MYKSATKCNETIGKWCKNKHGASKIIETIETYQRPHALHESKAPKHGHCRVRTSSGMQAKPISHALARGATHTVTLLPLHVEHTSAPPSIRNPRLKECRLIPI
jgi:hypothetical protein